MEENDLFVPAQNLDAEIRQIRGWLATNRAIANNFLLISAKDQLADLEARRQKFAEALNDGRRKAIEAPGKSLLPNTIHVKKPG
jgi:hypothetical protein